MVDIHPPPTGTRRARLRHEIADAIAFAQISQKFYYDRLYQPRALNVGDYALLRLRASSIQSLDPLSYFSRAGTLCMRRSNAAWRGAVG
jgi:hypothetical protein